MKLLQKMNNYKSFDFIYLSLENYILLFVFYDVIKFEIIENNRILEKLIFYYLKNISEQKLTKIALMSHSLCQSNYK